MDRPTEIQQSIENVVTNGVKYGNIEFDKLRAMCYLLEIQNGIIGIYGSLFEYPLLKLKLAQFEINTATNQYRYMEALRFRAKYGDKIVSIRKQIELIQITGDIFENAKKEGLRVEKGSGMNFMLPGGVELAVGFGS